MKKRSSLLGDSLKFCHFWARIYFCFQTSGSGNWTGQLEAAAVNPTKKLWVEKLQNCFSSSLTKGKNKLGCLALAIFLDWYNYYAQGQGILNEGEGTVQLTS